MLPHFAEVCCASIPAKELGALAAVRVVPGVEVYQQQEKDWVRWEKGMENVLASLLAIPGVALYAWRDGRWHRPGAVLPAFDVPAHGEFRPLHQVLFPAAVQPLPADADARPWKPVRLDLVPDHRPRPTSAMLVPAHEILAWTESVPSFRLSQILAACNGNEVLLLGSRLPPVLSGKRFWGKMILVPLGMRLEPVISERMIAEALDLDTDHLLLVREAGEQMIPREAFEPLHRAGLRRLAQEVSR
jgi:hypothetical protein